MKLVILVAALAGVYPQPRQPYSTYLPAIFRAEEVPTRNCY